MADARHLLVPITVQALVIDDLVVEKKATIKIGDQRNVANDGKWSPKTQDYRQLTNALIPPAPRPFYGARRTDGALSADQLVLPADPPDKSLLPQSGDRGVYLHWVLPSGLRHAYTPGALDFPALPDQWLIVRFSRRGVESKTNAWFVDSGLVVKTGGPANLLMADGNRYAARRVGKVVRLDEFKPDDFKGDRTTISAIGNAQTGSPTFTAYVAENRNILSWHDSLNDLREPSPDGQIPKDVALTYLLLGWYHTEQNEPLAALPVKLIDKHDEPNKARGWLIEPPGWFIDSTAPPPADLLKRRCLFHGMAAHINYWSSDDYKGPMLGYPGSPSVGGVLGDAPPSFVVGIGNNAEDALVSLVSSQYSGEKKAPNLWKALEAVIYRQPESLVGSWNAAPRDMAVHQSWFSTIEAGKVWAIRPRPRDENAFPTDPDRTAAQTAVRPTPEHLAALKQLNELQFAADAAGRELAALQQEFYARWWKMCEQSRLDEDTYPVDEETYCQTLAGRVTTLRTQLGELLGRLQPLPDALKNKLPDELELRYDDAPRFWKPADPVIVVKNCGQPTKHQFPNPLPCRLSEQTVTAAEVVVDKQANTFNRATGVSGIAALAQKYFAPRSEILTGLLNEASLVEQAISDLVARTRLTEKRFFTDDDWRKWTGRLVENLAWDGQSSPLPRDQIRFGKPSALNVPPHRLAALWAQQPWSPLFLDWQITWFPTAQSGQEFGPVWRFEDYDYRHLENQSPPGQGVTVRGRSLLSPIDGRLFKEPLETLRELLQGSSDNEDGNPAFPAVVRNILSAYQIVWDKTLGELASAGLMGQALTGFHQTLLRRDVTLPRVTPDPARPWAADNLEFRDDKAKALLAAPGETVLVGERLAPPALTTSSFPFNLLRAGGFKLDELWLVDDFGQWADLLRGTSAGGSAGQVIHPRARWSDTNSVVAMPPRVVQPVRLNFRFTSADDQKVESDLDSALSPICGWIFFNPLDQALVLCDRAGQLAGELVIIEARSQFRVQWEAGAGGVGLGDIRNGSLKAFAQALVESTPTANPRLHALLKLIDRALERIRPAAARREATLFGRPLALVSATLGLELYGKAWTDPRDEPVAECPSGTGNARLDALQLPVHLGCSHNTEDGLVGYFKAGVYDRIIPAHLPQAFKPSGYIGDPEGEKVRAGFGPALPLTLLLDPWGSVQAAVGIVPAKTITLAQAELDRALAKMEASFRVGPILLQADRLALPTPAGDQGRWNFSGPLTGHAAAPIIASDPRHFSDQPVVATEGRLLLLTPEK